MFFYIPGGERLLASTIFRYIYKYLSLYIYKYIYIVLTYFGACHFVEFHNELEATMHCHTARFGLERGNIKLAVAQLEIVYKVPMEHIDI